RFDKPDLVFKSGEILSLNATNNRILMRVYGDNSEDWIHKQIQLVLGQVKFQGELQDSVVVKPLDPPVEKPTPVSPEPPAQTPKRGRCLRMIPSATAFPLATMKTKPHNEGGGEGHPRRQHSAEGSQSWLVPPLTVGLRRPAPFRSSARSSGAGSNCAAASSGS